MFIICYGVTSLYFASAMVRLVVVFAPAACVLGAIAISSTLRTYFGKSRALSIGAALLTGLMLASFVRYSHTILRLSYSSPFFIFPQKMANSGDTLNDDFRQAYRWLEQNTPEDARIMAWWDWGYQISSMANRTVLVDNNIWNNTHIGTVGRVMSLTEEEAYPILQSLEVDYIFVVTGGATGFQDDDMSKLIWMIRIAGKIWPEITEHNYFREE